MAIPNLYRSGMGANPGDSQQISLVKIVAQLAELLALNGMSVPKLYAAGMGPNTGDSPQISLVKIVALLKAFVDEGVGGTSFQYWENSGPVPSGPPFDQTQVWTVHFRDGFPSRIWDPSILDWR